MVSPRYNNSNYTPRGQDIYFIDQPEYVAVHMKMSKCLNHGQPFKIEGFYIFVFVLNCLYLRVYLL